MGDGVKWIGADHFVVPAGGVESRFALPTRHTVLDRLHDEPDLYNKLLTTWSVGPERYFIWRMNCAGKMECLFTSKTREVIQIKWTQSLNTLPCLEFDNEGFFVAGDSTVRLGQTVEVIPERIRVCSLNVDNWVVRLKYNNDWERLRFPVYGKERLKFMRMFAKLDEPMTIKFRKHEFLAWT